MNSHFLISKWDEVENTLKSRLQQAPLDEWGHIPAVRNRQWATPNWTIALLGNDNSLIGFLNIIERELLFDDQEIDASGINNVIVFNPYRGLGYGEVLMQRAQEFFTEELKSDIGLLLCADEVSGFYEKLGWKKFKGPLLYDQPNEKLEWHQNVYLFSSKVKLDFEKIDLCGLPW
ncbi:MAG: GNAT family N-acetyltransferase [Bdellovibrionales bacterium]|nr:GNAT family N-acetyltransferase [Bdellovibrionales bacterium]